MEISFIDASSLQHSSDVYSLVVLCRMEGLFAMSKEDAPAKCVYFFVPQIRCRRVGCIPCYIYREILHDDVDHGEIRVL